MTPEEKFSNYASNYNMDDPQIRLKAVHTFQVLKAADAIAASLDLDENQKREAHLAALFHDIGRFEQVRRFHTFTDSRSIPHAALSAEILEEGDFLDELDEKARSRVIEAVRVHSDFAIPEEHEGWQRTLDQIVRDADKVDIFRVAWQENSKDTIDTQLINGKDEISPAVLDAVYAHRSILRADRHTELDFWVSFLGFFFDVNMPRSFELILEQGYWNKPLIQWLESHPQAVEALKEQIEGILDECESYIEQKKK